MTIQEILLSIALGTLFLCLILIMVRFIKGPTLPDRIISLDLFSSTLIGILVIYAVVSGMHALLDVALVLSLVAFLGTMVFAKYLLTKENKK